MQYMRLMELAGYLNEELLAEERFKCTSSQSHPLAGEQITPEEWRAVGAFIKYLVAQRKNYYFFIELISGKQGRLEVAVTITRKLLWLISSMRKLRIYTK